MCGHGSNKNVRNFRTLENDVCYLIEVTKPKFFFTLMEKFKSDFVPS